MAVGARPCTSPPTAGTETPCAPSGRWGGSKTLIRAGAPLDHVNNLGWTALIESIVLVDGGARHSATLRALVEAGRTVNLPDPAATPRWLARAATKPWRSSCSKPEPADTRSELTDRTTARIFFVYPQRGVVMQTKIQKWGNSLGLRIPKSFAAEAQVEDGSTVDLSVENGRLLVRPLRARKYALAQLLKKVNARNVHGEVATGVPRGREAW